MKIVIFDKQINYLVFNNCSNSLNNIQSILGFF